LIQIQFERSSKGIKLDKNLQEEIKAFSIRIDSENYAKLLGYCLEKIRNLKLSSINQAYNHYLIFFQVLIFIQI